MRACGLALLLSFLLAACGGDRTLYVVDDDAEFRMCVRRVAERMSWPVIECSDGQEFVDTIARLRRPGTVILDMMMPQLDGIQAVHRISEFCVDVDIFLITGGPSVYALAARQIAETGNLRVRRILTKPIDLDEMKEILGETCPA